MQQGNITKYRALRPVDLKDRTWPDKAFTQPPRWVSVDLRDGNQALPVPMTIEQKLTLFRILVDIGFKEIEVGFPSAADTEYRFTRRLIEENIAPEDVSLQVLTQAREHLIRKSYESLKGAHKATLHLYNSTSTLQRKVTFGNATRERIKDIAIEGTRLCKQLLDTVPGTDVQFQYSPESFTDTEPDFALEVCEAVMEIWEPTVERPMVLNLPATVEYYSPNLYADYIEWFCRNLKERDKALISLHTHNDRGTGVAATELGMLAGADRVEGTLFGNGERTGNLDIVTVALNLYAQGIDPQLKLGNLDEIREIYERTTRMTVPERWPYAGELVFTAFSGSHQDAIKKGMDLRTENNATDADPWEVPYLHIDPRDIGRTYEAIIRINSQSGKGGVAYVLSREHGLELPKSMHPEVGQFINSEADRLGKELSADEINELFLDHYIRKETPLKLVDYTIKILKDKQVELTAQVSFEGQDKTITGVGNGPINAFVHALESVGWKNFNLTNYRSHAIGGGSATESAAYVQLKRASDDLLFWGCGINTNIEAAGLYALISAYNNAASR